MSMTMSSSPSLSPSSTIFSFPPSLSIDAIINAEKLHHLLDSVILAHCNLSTTMTTIVSLLSKNAIDINRYDYMNDRLTLLMKALLIVDYNDSGPTIISSNTQHPPLIHLILQHRPDINAMCRQQQTALTKACRMKRLRAVEMLLKLYSPHLITTSHNIINLNLPDISGRTCLTHACVEVQPGIVSALLAASSACPRPYQLNLNHTDHDGKTPLHHCICIPESRYSTASSRVIEIATMLLQSGCAINLQDKQGYTPLMYACLYKRTEIVQLLLSQRTYFDLNLTDHTGQTCLHLACTPMSNETIDNIHHSDTVESLVRLVPMGLCLHHRDDQGRTAMDLLNSVVSANARHLSNAAPGSGPVSFNNRVYPLKISRLLHAACDIHTIVMNMIRCYLEEYINEDAAMLIIEMCDGINHDMPPEI